MTWTVETQRSKIEFSVRHMMISTVKGSFGDIEAVVDFNPDEVGSTKVEASVSAISVDTRDRLRDAYLRGQDGFNPEQHPRLTLTLSGIQLRGQNVQIDSRLTVKGHEQPLRLSGRYLSPTGAIGQRSCRFSLQGEVEREKLGLGFHSALETGGVVVGKKVKIALEVFLVEG